MILGEGSLEAQAKDLVSDKPVPAQPTNNETSLLAAEIGQSPTPYRRGIIGKHDLTLSHHPAGSIVEIDTQKLDNCNSKKLDPEVIRAAHLFPDDSGRLCLRLVRVGQKLRLADLGTAFAIASPKQEMEVQDRNRKHRACHQGGRSTGQLDYRRGDNEHGAHAPQHEGTRNRSIIAYTISLIRRISLSSPWSFDRKWSTFRCTLVV